MNTTDLSDLLLALGLPETATAAEIFSALCNRVREDSTNAWFLHCELDCPEWANLTDRDEMDSMFMDAVDAANTAIHGCVLQCLQDDADHRHLLDSAGEPVEWDTDPLTAGQPYGDPITLDLARLGDLVITDEQVRALNDSFGSPAEGDDLTAMELLQATGVKQENLWHDLCREVGIDSDDYANYPPTTMEEARGCINLIVKATYRQALSAALENALPELSVDEHNRILDEASSDDAKNCTLENAAVVGQQHALDYAEA